MIRAATQEDAAGIAAIWNPDIQDTTITFTTDEKTVEGLCDLIETRCVLVSERGGAVAGFATFGPFRSGPGYARVAEHTIMLDEAARGQGTGAALLAALEDAARAEGIVALVAGISGENSAAIGFHVRQGFEQVGLLPKVGRKFGRALDLVLMQKFIESH